MRLGEGSNFPSLESFKGGVAIFIRCRAELETALGSSLSRTRFPIEADQHRRNFHKRGSLLIVLIDADTRESEDRYRELFDQANEKRNVFIFVPKRNIETWFHQMSDHSVNEVEDYKPVYRKDAKLAIAIAVRQFLFSYNSPSQPLNKFAPSLEAGIKTARQVPKSHEPDVRSLSYTVRERSCRNSSIFTSSVG